MKYQIFLICGTVTTVTITVIAYDNGMRGTPLLTAVCATAALLWITWKALVGRHE